MSKRRKRTRRSNLDFQKLETRNLLAGLHLNASTGVMTVIGDNGDNVGQVDQIDANTIRATVDGQQADYDISQVNTLYFVGYNGNDHFTNNTSIEGGIFGHGGDDVLIGGPGNDLIVGGLGQDVIYGNDGDDVLKGAANGNEIYGGRGNDQIFGGNDENFLSGDDGDDVIFGGTANDIINGGNGADQIYSGDGDDTLNGGAGGYQDQNGTYHLDLIMGNAGNDIITAETGINALWGGAGDDILTGGQGENRIFGQDGADQLTGGPLKGFLSGGDGNDTIDGGGGDDAIVGGKGNDTLRGGTGNDYFQGDEGNDMIFGEEGNDFLFGGTGDDTIDGGEGSDTVYYPSVFSNFTVTGSVSDLDVVDSVSSNGNDEVDVSEYLLFTDGIQSATPNTEVVQVQPIIASDTDGSNQAEFFGDAAQEADIKQRIDEIFAQANVQVDWLSERTWNNTNINVGSGGGERPTSDLEYVTDTGDATPNIGHTNALVLDMYFMERVPGFEDVGEDSANGLAFLGQNGIAAHVGDNLVSFPAGRAVIARVMAHEIAHNLGLDHVHIEDNLMDDGTELTPSQIQTVLSSSYTQA